MQGTQLLCLEKGLPGIYMNVDMNLTNTYAD